MKVSHLQVALGAALPTHTQRFKQLSPEVPDNGALPTGCNPLCSGTPATQKEEHGTGTSLFALQPWLALMGTAVAKELSANFNTSPSSPRHTGSVFPRMGAGWATAITRQHRESQRSTVLFLERGGQPALGNLRPHKAERGSC